MHPEEQIGQICETWGGITAFLVSYDHFLCEMAEGVFWVCAT